MRGLNLWPRVALALALAGACASPTFAATVVRTFTFSPEDVEIATDGSGHQVYRLRGAVPWGEPGTPELPALSLMVDLPANSRAVRAETRASGFVSLGRATSLRPAQPASTQARPAAWVEAEPAAFAARTWLPAETAELTHSGFLRGRALAALRVQPVQVVPATGEVRLATRIEVTLEVEPQQDALRPERVVAEWESEFTDVFERAFASGPEYLRQGLRPTGAMQFQSTGAADGIIGAEGPQPFAPTALPSVQGSPVKYLILTNEALKPHFDSLATWKTQKGVPTVVRTVEFVNANYPFGVDLAERLRLFIRDAYLQWGVQYALLGGDTPIIPARHARTTFFGGEYISTDLYYSDVDRFWSGDGDSLWGEGFTDSTNLGDGVDLLPDVWVGRAPVENPFEASVFVNKVLNYEKNLPADFAARRALFFAEVYFPQDWQFGMPVSLDGADQSESVINKVPGLLNPRRLYENWQAKTGVGALPETRAVVLDSLNHGAFNVLNHFGHGFRNSMSVGDAPLTNPDIKPLVNSPRLSGLLYSINCTSAAIEFESIGEEFLLAPSGGACSNVGSTHFDFPTTGHAYQLEFFELVYNQGLQNLGRAAALQKIPFVGFATFDNVHRWTQFTLVYLGDPEMPLWTADLAPLVVAHPASVTLSDSSIAVNVTSGGNPVANARVCLWKGGEEYRVVTTDSNGDAVVPLRPLTTGTAKLTVTKNNFRFYQTDVTVNSFSGAVLVARPQDRVIGDSGGGGTNGNNDGSLDAGETVDVTIPVRNVGGFPSGQATGKLLSLDARVTVLQDSVTYGIVNNGATVNGAPYRIAVSHTGVTDGDELKLRIILRNSTGGEWRQNLHLVVRAPQLRMLSHLLNDNGTGNGDQFLDVGETASYTVTLVNLKEAPARTVTATLQPAGSGVAVLNGNATFGNIGPDGQAAGTAFTIQNTSASQPRFLLTVSDAYGVRHSQPVDFGKPAAPTNLKGIGSATAINLVWTKSGAADLEGYNVYRSTNQGGPFSKTNFLPTGRIAYFLNEGLASLTRYYYYVTAVDSSGNESSPTTTISASTNPPALNGFPIPMERTTPSSPVVADIDGDGDLEVFVGADVLYAWHASGQGVRDADGSERTSGDFTTQGVYYASAPAIADIDRDGTLEVIAVAWESKQLFVFRPDGTNKPGFPKTLLDNVWSSPAIGDIDGDGFDEIIFNSNGTRVYAYNHDGTEVRDGDANAGTNGVFAVLGGSFNFGSPALVDLDGDGREDVLLPCTDGKMYAFRGDGTTLPGFPFNSFAPITGSPAVGDLDNDGIVEIVFPSENNRVNVITPTGTVKAGFPKTGIPTSGNSRMPTPALADVDNDGLREIVHAGTDGQLRIIRSNGAFQSGWTAVRFSALTAKATESSPVVADIDGNGTPEILIGSEDGQLYGFDNAGQPFAGFPIRTDGEVRGTPVIWDFDQNGTAEILLAGWDKNLYCWTYPGTYVYNPLKHWVMFGHDNRRTNRRDVQVVVGVEQSVAAFQLEPIDGGVGLSWKLPFEAAGLGGAWRVYRAEGTEEGAPQRLEAVPQGFAAVGPEALTIAEGGWLRLEDRTVVPGSNYRYVLERRAGPGEERIVYGPYAVLAPATAPERAFLAAAFPNPAQGTQTLSFGLPAGFAPETVVRLELFDVRGAKVRTLVHRAAEGGRFTVSWDGRDDGGRRVPGGVYLYRLAAGPHVLQGRLVRLTP